MIENVPVPDVGAYVGSIGFLPNSYHHAMQECVEEMACRVAEGEKRLAELEMLHGGAIGPDAKVTTTRYHDWDLSYDALREKYEQLCKDKSSNEAETKLAALRAEFIVQGTKNIRLRVETSKLRGENIKLREENDRLVDSLHLASTRADEAKKEVTFLTEENARLHRKCNHMREVAEQASARANHAETGLCSFNAKNVAFD